MNIAFFLTPKCQTVWLPTDASVRDAMERMDQSGFTALPVLDEQGLYVRTLTEGDLLRKLVRSAHLTDIDRVKVMDVPALRAVRAVGIEAEVEALFSRAIEQNFVPVVDSRNVFVGIVRRREILVYCTRSLRPARE